MDTHGEMHEFGAYDGSDHEEEIGANEYPDSRHSHKKNRTLKNPIKFKITLNEEQLQVQKKIDKDVISVLSGKAGSGKAQPLHSIIKTPSGDVRMGDIRIGDAVCTPDGKTANVIGIFPQGVEDVYRVTFSDGLYTECSLEHLWNVRKVKRTAGDDYITVTTGDIIDFMNSGGQYKIPVTSPVQYQHKDVKIDPYVMGILISEGCLSRRAISFSTSDDHILNRVRERIGYDSIVGKSSVYDFSITSGNRIPGSALEVCVESTGEIFDTVDSYCNDRGISKYDHYNNPNRNTEVFVKRKNSRSTSDTLKHLISYGMIGKLSYDKFVPDDYKVNSIEVRLELLRGLMDGDGYVDKTGYIEYSTSSERLKNDVVDIVNSLGGVCRVRSKFPTYTYKNEKKKSTHLTYSVTINLPHFDIVSLPRKKERVVGRTKYMPSRIIKKVEKVGRYETQCIKIDSEDELYLTDNYIVTHNTLLAVRLALEGLFTKQYEKIIITRPTVSNEDLGFLPGDIKEKMDPWLAPIYANMYDCYDKAKITKHMADGTIEIAPISFLRGRTFCRSFVIIDEAQNVTKEQTKMILTRIGKGSKMILCGDRAQVDLKRGSDSGFAMAFDLAKTIKGIGAYDLKTNMRHPIVDAILEQIDE